VARRLSPQTIAVLIALAREPEVWRHGYDLVQELGVQAGTLYPILMRLCDRGLLEAAWEDDPPLGRPRRHLYRILAEGQRVAASSRASGAPSFRVLAGGAR
jgi:DNA-binding PadR family transcriptional regulator